MIVFDLRCDAGHRFEAWFASSEAYERQQAGGLVSCPTCGSSQVGKAVTAARLGGTGPAGHETGDVRAMIGMIAAAQARALKDSQWVGGDFARRARELHDEGQADTVIHGQASPDEARSLVDDGIAVMPLIVPVVPPEQRN